MISKASSASATALACALVFGTVQAHAAATDYRFELAGKPEPSSAGKSVVPVRLVHVPDSKPVTDAVIFESKADMGPAGMAVMTAPVKAIPPQNGVYRFEVAPSMTGVWAVTLAAKVQGETETVRGSITTDLVK